MKAAEAFWKMSKDHRWRFTDSNGDFPEKIGGRDVDVTQLAYSIRDLVRSNYAINAVPPHLVEKLQALDVFCKQAELLIDEIVSEVVEHAITEIEAYEKSKAGR